MIKKIIVTLCLIFVSATAANAYQLLSSKELGRNDAKNQTVVVKCTTDTGKVSSSGSNKKCNGWQPWQDLRSPGKKYSDWRSAASACCRAKGLR